MPKEIVLREVVEFLGTPKTRAELRQRFDLSPGAVHNLCKSLKQYRVVEWRFEVRDGAEREVLVATKDALNGF